MQLTVIDFECRDAALQQRPFNPRRDELLG